MLRFKSFLLSSMILTSTFAFGQITPLQQGIKNYSELVHSSYQKSLVSAKELQNAIKAFTRNPSVITLEMARAAWKSAREPYGKTEVFRFYNGPIDADGGPEGELNAWPLDEAYIDYVQGNPTAGIINNLTTYPQITKDLLKSLNELDGEKNVSTGYHAIEFLLWGQDFLATGPGQRSHEDYTTAPNAARRAQYLNVVAQKLVDDLSGLVKEWKPNATNYRAEFEALPEAAALKKILSGVIFMTGDELSGERMYVAYDTQGQEDEHSCFSDMTHMDIRWNYLGIASVIRAIDLLNLPEIKDTEVAKKINTHLLTVPRLITAIPVPFDQAISSEPGRSTILSAVEGLEAMAKDLAEASKLLNAPVEF